MDAFQALLLQTYEWQKEHEWEEEEAEKWRQEAEEYKKQQIANAGNRNSIEPCCIKVLIKEQNGIQEHTAIELGLFWDELNKWVTRKSEVQESMPLINKISDV